MFQERNIQTMPTKPRGRKANDTRPVYDCAIGFQRDGTNWYSRPDDGTDQPSTNRWVAAMTYWLYVASSEGLATSQATPVVNRKMRRRGGGLVKRGGGWEFFGISVRSSALGGRERFQTPHVVSYMGDF
jgi:hypothetical protein